MRPIKLYLFTAGMVVQVVGPEIVNKREILEQALSYLNGCFEVRIRQSWMAQGKRSDIRAGERTGWISHWLRIAGQCAALSWRYYFEDRFLPKSVIQFVLYGDGAANVAMDPARYRFRSSAGLQWMHGFIPRPIEIVLLPESSGKIAAANGQGDDSSKTEQLHRWRTRAYNSEARNVVMAGESTTDSGQKLALAIVQEMDARFGVPQYKKLLRLNP